MRDNGNPMNAFAPKSDAADWRLSVAPMMDWTTYLLVQCIRYRGCICGTVPQPPARA